MSKVVFFIGFFLVAVVAITSMFIPQREQQAEVGELADLSEAQVKGKQMDNAYQLGETLFLYDAPQNGQRYALFYGQQRVVFLKEGILRGVVLTSQEALNLVVKQEYEPGEWSTIYSIQEMAPGDYVLFDGGWQITKYQPPVQVIATNPD